MIKKRQTLSTEGRRNKQQILKDFIRPAPANIISSPPTTVGGGGFGSGGGGYGCTPGGPHEPVCTGASSCSPGAWNITEFVDCDWLWTVGHDELVVPGDTVETPTETLPIENGSFSGRVATIPSMFASGPTDIVLFGATFLHHRSVMIQGTPTCEPNALKTSLTGEITFVGDYGSSPQVDYTVFGIGPSDAYQTQIVMNLFPVGIFGPTSNVSDLVYLDSSKFVYGSLDPSLPFGDLQTGWFWDQWAFHVIDTTNDMTWYVPIGASGDSIPFKFERDLESNGILHCTLGTYEYDLSVSAFTQTPFQMLVQRSINWNIGVGASLHREHFAAAYIGDYSELGIDLSIQHTIHTGTFYEPAPSNSRFIAQLIRQSATQYSFPQDVSSVYNVWVEGVLVPTDNWSFDGDRLTFTYDIENGSLITAEITVF